MKKNILLLAVLLSSLAIKTKAQTHNYFFLPTYWEISGKGMAFNIGSYDINRDGNPDIIVGNWNDTYIYYGGKGILDSTVDLIYKGRLLAICDYNGDGYKDMITLHFTSYDSTRDDYNGELLFYYGSNKTSLAIDTLPTYTIPLPTQYPTRDGFSLGGFKMGVETGDFNGDGKSDIVISSYQYPYPEDNGMIYIYMGADVPPQAPNFEVSGKYVDNDFGYYFEVGDINGDGFDDLLISSRRMTTRRDTVHTDSLYVLHVYYGGKNFTFYQDSESVKYISRVIPSRNWSGWFVNSFSLDDINGDGIKDLVVGRLGLNNSGTAIHYGTIAGIDTNTSLLLPPYPDTTDNDNVFGGISFDIGDFNGDGYDDFVFTPGGWKTFSLILGGPHISNRNPYGLRGLLEAGVHFPNKAIQVGDQNGDGENDFEVNANPYDKNSIGYIFIMLGNHLIKTDVKEKRNVIKGFNLYQNYPNPFNPSTVISYQLSAYSLVTLKIYDTLGREITTLVNQKEVAGYYKIEFNAEKYKLSSGVYFVELKVMDKSNVLYSQTKKLSLIK